MGCSDFQKEIEALINRFIPKLQFVMKLIGIAERIVSPVEVILFILAAVLGAYTGFLLSALISYPMLNNPVLPALFLASGTSSGIAATFLIILIAGKLKGDSHESHFIHKFEVPIMVTELGLIVCFFVGLHFGGGQKQLRYIMPYLVLGSDILGWSIDYWYLDPINRQYVCK